MKYGVAIKHVPGLSTDLVFADSDHAVLFGDRSGEMATGQQPQYSSRIGLVIKGSLASLVSPGA